MDRQIICAPDLINVIDRWIKSLSVEQRLSKHTLRAYITDLDHFLSFISSYEGEEISINTLSKLKINASRAWLSKKAQDNVSKTSRARSVSSIRNFFQYMDDEGVMHNPVFKMLSTPKLPHRVPRPVDITQAEKILQTSLDQSDDWVALRDYALFTMLYGCGLRINEALSLTIRDVELVSSQDGMVRIMGKGSKERFVPYLDIVKTRVNTYRKACMRIFPESQKRPVFIGVKGGMLNQGIAQKSMRSIRAQLDLPDNVTPHALRHSYATHLMGHDGLNMREIQDLLGHASLSTTQRYTEIDADAMMDIFKKAHPRSKK